VGEDGIVIGLNEADGEGEGGEGVLDKGFSGIGRHFFMELDDSEAGAAVNGGELIEFSALEEVRDEFDIDLEEVAGIGDDKGSAIAFGVRFSFAGQAFAFEDLTDSKSRG